MEEFDDKLPKRRFDNFQFVPFSDTMQRAENREVTFSIAALQEIPEQVCYVLFVLSLTCCTLVPNDPKPWPLVKFLYLYYTNLFISEMI